MNISSISDTKRSIVCAAQSRPVHSVRVVDNMDLTLRRLVSSSDGKLPVFGSRMGNVWGVDRSMYKDFDIEGIRKDLHNV